MTLTSHAPRPPRSLPASRSPRPVPDARAALARLDDDERRAFDRRYQFASKFADEADARRTPSGLRMGYTPSEYLALSRADRVAVLQAAVVGDVLAGRVMVTRRKPTPAPAPAAAPEPAAPSVSALPDVVPVSALGRYVVACAGGCGSYLPARGPRPVVVYCQADRPRRAPVRAWQF